MSVKGDRELMNSLEKLCMVDMYDAVASSIKMVQAEAKERAVGKKSSGELRGSIYTDVETGDDYVRGTCYTNKSYAPYVEFGTGPVGQENHDGVSPEVEYAYNQTGWIMPSYAMSKNEAEDYGLGIVRNKKGEIIGYSTNGQAANPFMYPAIKNQEKEILNNIKSRLKSNIKIGK